MRQQHHYLELPRDGLLHIRLNHGQRLYLRLTLVSQTLRQLTIQGGGANTPLHQPSTQRSKNVEHSMLAGAVPVPVHPDTGKREVGGYEFFYDGWKHPSPNKSNTRMGATKENLFPKDRSVQLDADVLKRLGLTKQRIENCDALFFYQLLLPIVDPAHSGIKDDPRIGFYEEVATHTNVYAMGNKNRGVTRGHVFRPTNAEELLVCWDGIVTRNLADNVAESWMASQSNTYDREIDEAMHYRRWLDIKACMKLCNFYREKDRKATDYDPTEKYRLVWDTMTHNMRQVIKKMGLDHTIDEVEIDVVLGSNCYHVFV